MTEVEKLRAAKALIEDPKNWTTEEYARNRSGERAYYDTYEAVCWCAMGALYRCGGSVEIMRLAARQLGNGSPTVVNDNLGHAAVMEMYDHAIALAERPVQ